MTRFQPPTASDSLAHCDDCGHEAMHDLLYWDDANLVYRCQACQRRQREREIAAMEKENEP